MSRKNPWKTLSTKIVRSNPWFKLREDRVIRPDGKPGTYSFILAPRAVGVVPCFQDGTVLLVGQYRYPLDAYSWEIPEGGSREQEQPIQTARRELREETGYRAGTFKSLGILHTSNCFTDEVAHLFYATDLKPGKDDQDGTEQIVTRRLPFKEAWQMAVDGKITDSLTLVALFRLQAKGIFK